MSLDVNEIKADIKRLTEAIAYQRVVYEAAEKSGNVNATDAALELWDQYHDERKELRDQLEEVATNGR